MVQGSEPSTAAGSPAGNSTGGSSAATGPSSSVALVSPLLTSFAFGSQLGLPLVCEVAAGSIGPFLTNPSLGKIVLTIVDSCQQAGVEGKTSLEALNAKLGALAAVDPAVDPLLTKLAAVFDQLATNSAIPFASSILDLANLVAFFES